MPDDAMLALVAIIAVLMWEATRRFVGPMFLALLADINRRSKQSDEMLAVERVLLQCNYDPTDPPEQQARILRHVAAEVGYPSERVLDKVAGDFGIERKDAAEATADLAGTIIGARATLRDGRPAHVQYGSRQMATAAMEVAQERGEPTLCVDATTGTFSISEDMRVEFERVVSSDVRDGAIHPTETKWEVVRD